MQFTTRRDLISLLHLPLATTRLELPLRVKQKLYDTWKLHEHSTQHNMMVLHHSCTNVSQPGLTTLGSLPITKNTYSNKHTKKESSTPLQLVNKNDE